MQADQLYRVRVVDGGISTDDIIPARYKHMHTDPASLAPHVFENRYPGLAATLREGDVLVCRGLFGIGSSREQAVSSLMAAGVRAVLAPSFGRIFFRNAWNLGLPVLELDTTTLEEGMSVTVDLASGQLSATRELPRFIPPSAEMLRMIEAGGLLPMVISSLPNVVRRTD